MKRFLIKRICIAHWTIFLILLIITSGVALSDKKPTWTIETVASDVFNPGGISMILDSADNPHICYGSGSRGVLKYAKKKGLSWDVRTIDNPGDVMDVSLALDSSNYPHICYYDWYADHKQLLYIYWDGSSWNKQIVTKVGSSPSASISVDSSNTPHISYLDVNNWNLKYAKLGSDWDWEFQRVDGGNEVGYNNCIALDSSGIPHIFYYDLNGNDLKFARWNGSAWVIKIVDNLMLSEEDSVPSLSIDIDSTDFPHISYGMNKSNLRYAKWKGAKKGWTILTINDKGYVGGCSAIALDPSDKPHIAYYDDTNGDLRYARWDGSIWQHYNIKKVNPDLAIRSGKKISIAVDSSGNPHIAYTNRYTGTLEYAKGLIPKPEVAKVASDKAEDTINKSKVSPKTPPSKLLKVAEPKKIAESGVGIQASAPGWQKIWGPVTSVFLGYDPAKKSTIVYATNRTSGDIYKYTGKWEKVGGPGAMFAADHSGHLYGLSPDKSTVVEYVETSRKWKRIGGSADHIYAGGDNLYATNPETGDIYEYSRDTGKWIKAGGAAAMFAVDSTGQLFSLSSDKSGVFRYSGKRMQWTKVGGEATHIYAGGNKLFAISPAGGDIYGYSSVTNKWSKVGGPGKMFAVGFLGHLYGISSDGSAIYSCSETTGKWSKIGVRSAGIIAGGNTLYSIDPMMHELYMLKFAGQDATPIHLPAIKDE